MKSLWTAQAASIIGFEHQFVRTNKQDFCKVVQTEDITIGIVCDGCSSGKFSEVGSTLIGYYVLQCLREYSYESDVELELFVQNKLIKFLDDLMNLMQFKDDDRVHFVENCLSSTVIFCVIKGDYVYIGHCGDGIYIVNRGEKSEVVNIDQDNLPHYLAYHCVPPEALMGIDLLKGISVQQYNFDDIDSVIIGSDGIEPLLSKNMVTELLHTKGRQLQRKFNVWHEMFSDDASCVVFEKIQNVEIK